ncbi:rhodanese-like domain-containing protein [Chondrinema litorale]|uniref:rhodanese-like domain-containing protein n=1 Tax=Chondrinema litorale TaxID=2994555 RepID=UPI002543E445|nr:rhodanese-like domain-containing protein [Chondrinema litorale]UZR97240.1 rhodanese-like domain-containing protein [Chondrinema litorale]
MKKLFIITLFTISSISLFAQENSVIVKNINSDELHDMLENDMQLVDVRTGREYQRGHIKGAKLISINSADFNEKVNELNKDKLVVVYCAVGGRSTAAMRKLKDMGFKEIYNFVGGVREWQMNKYELVKE